MSIERAVYFIERRISVGSGYSAQDLYEAFKNEDDVPTLDEWKAAMVITVTTGICRWAIYDDGVPAIARCV